MLVCSYPKKSHVESQHHRSQAISSSKFGAPTATQEASGRPGLWEVQGPPDGCTMVDGKHHRFVAELEKDVTTC